MQEKRRARSPEEIWRVSSQTRLKAWALFTEYQQSGLDEETALRKALKQACPSREDPYYAAYYPNKKREFALWKKYGLWPLFKTPKALDYGPVLHDSIDIADDTLTDILDNLPEWEPTGSTEDLGQD